MTEPQTGFRRLYRSRTNRQLAGVLGGIAEYANLDPTAVRVLYVIATIFTGGVLVIAYPVMWALMPEQ
jgi:phage shock protein C